jgi:hypothetical protein
MRFDRPAKQRIGVKGRDYRKSPEPLTSPPPITLTLKTVSDKEDERKIPRGRKNRDGLDDSPIGIAACRCSLNPKSPRAHRGGKRCENRNVRELKR